MDRFAACSAELPDSGPNARHELLEVIVIALPALLCRAESSADMADFGRARQSPLQPILKLPHGISFAWNEADNGATVPLYRDGVNWAVI